MVVWQKITYDLDKIRIEYGNFCSHANKESYLNWAGLTGLAFDLKTREFFLHNTIIKAAKIKPFSCIEMCTHERE
jgi:hypothetical protein